MDCAWVPKNDSLVIEMNYFANRYFIILRRFSEPYPCVPPCVLLAPRGNAPYSWRNLSRRSFRRFNIPLTPSLAAVGGFVWSLYSSGVLGMWQGASSWSHTPSSYTISENLGTISLINEISCRCNFRCNFPYKIYENSCRRNLGGICIIMRFCLQEFRHISWRRDFTIRLSFDLAPECIDLAPECIDLAPVLWSRSRFAWSDPSFDLAPDSQNLLISLQSPLISP